jgi:hypothetical protein
VIRSPRNELVIAAACQLIASSITLKEILLEGRSSVPHWRTILDLGIKHRKSTVQEAAATALAAVSKLVDCSAVVQRYVDTLYSGSFGIRLATDLQLHIHQRLQVGFAYNAARPCASFGPNGLQEPFPCTSGSHGLPCCVGHTLGRMSENPLHLLH